MPTTWFSRQITINRSRSMIAIGGFTVVAALETGRWVASAILGLVLLFVFFYVFGILDR